MKTNNYLGKQNENRGIIAFLIIFFISIIIISIVLFNSKINNHKESKGISSIDEMYYELEKSSCLISRFEINEDKLVLDGELTENVNDFLLSKLTGIQLVFKNKEGDKYIFDLDYFISTEGIEFSTVLSDEEEEFLVSLSDIQQGEYFVFLRTKTESSNAEDGYFYKYYTLENQTENNELNYQNMRILFSSSNKVENFLTIVNM